jgi:hypothetical protein
VFFAPEWAGCSSSRRTSSRPICFDAAAHRAGLVLHAVLRDPARGSGVPEHAGLGRARAVRGRAAAVLRALARPFASKSIRYRGPIYKVALMVFAANFIVLGYCGMKPAVQPFKGISVVGTLIYFAFFLLMPWYSRIDRTRPEPSRVTS